jgi:hypothetical protein
MVLSITQHGAQLTAEGGTYVGMVGDEGWELYNSLPPLGYCPTGPPAELEYLIRGTLPDTSGVVNVEQMISWLNFIQPPVDPCPECTVLWQGTMVRLQ